MCNKAELEDTLRHSALEVMVSLCESSAAMMRKRGAAFIGPLIKICLALMVELEDDADWHAADNLDDDDDNNAAVGETSLDRIATSLGGKAVFPAAMQLIPPMLQSRTLPLPLLPVPTRGREDVQRTGWTGTRASWPCPRSGRAARR